MLSLQTENASKKRVSVRQQGPIKTKSDICFSIFNILTASYIINLMCIQIIYWLKGFVADLHGGLGRLKTTKLSHFNATNLI